MNFLFLIAITLKISGTLQKKAVSSSDESIENILYYKDCNKPTAKPAPVPETFRHEEPPPKPECVPRMCCSMSCSNTCGQDQDNTQQLMSGGMPPMLSRQLTPPNAMPMSSVMQAMQPNSQQPILPFTQRARKKKLPLPKPGTRRSFGFTRDHIKALISHDEDIKKILKDLVRVTMQKVDLVDQINSRRNANIANRLAQVNRNVNNRVMDEYN